MLSRQERTKARITGINATLVGLVVAVYIGLLLGVVTAVTYAAISVYWKFYR